MGRPPTSHGVSTDLSRQGSVHLLDQAKRHPISLNLIPDADIDLALGTAFEPKRIRRSVPLAPFTTFKIGGAADWFLEVRSADELAQAVLTASSIGLPWFVLGVGANILVGDKGFRGLVIRNRASSMEVLRDAGQVRAESGAIVYPDLIALAVENGLSGLEHFVGIPSTVGGALWQNLHFLSPPPARERTVFLEEVLHEAEVLTEEGTRRTVGVGYFNFAYDYSILHVRNDIVLSATFQLEHADPGWMRSVMEANITWRRERHPPLDSEPSAGSIFKKVEGVGAGRLIDECGLKGHRIGGAEITRRHANIIINRENATARDVIALIEHVQHVVLDRTGYALEPEILMVGEF